ncbi:MAG: hypothetical protein ABMA25_22905 [Ilumatobacteraceae bacterium]
MKNRARIIGLAVAGVAGTSGAAFAGMSVQDEQSSAQPVIAEATTTATAEAAGADGTVTYQVGAAGTVAVTRTAGSLSVSSATAGAGWSVLAISGPGGHVEVQFTDTFQLVTFGADAVGDDISVSLANVAAPGVETTLAPAAPIEVQIISGGDSGPGTTWAPAPQPATPAPTPTAPQTTHAPATTQPAPATTAAPSSGGEEDDDDHEDEGDEHESEQDDD